jgi:biopolymer transport protein ExbD
VTGAEEFFLGKDKVTKQGLIAAVMKQLKSSKSDVLYLRADYGLRYEKVAKLISSLKRAGISNIALVTETEKEQVGQ